MNNSTPISLLQYLTSEQVDDLIIEYHLKEKGYKISYFIDNYDISKYSFPFGLLPTSDKDKRKNSPIEVITDEQLAYHFLINREEKLLLFDEHIEELNDYIKKIKWVEYYSNNIINSLQEFINYFDKKKSLSLEEFKESVNLFSSDNVSLLISIALGALYDGKKKLNNLLNKTLVHNNKTNINNEYHPDIFDKCKADKTTEKLFDELISQYNRSNLNRLISRYNKCKIYDRLICINKKSSQSKHLYFLLSSSTILSKRLPDIANKLNYKIEINEKTINPIRTISQIYLELLISNNDNYFEILQDIKKIIELKENSENTVIAIEIDNFLVEFGNKKSSYQREIFENASLLLNIDQYSNEINRAINSRNLFGNIEIINSIKELLVEAQNPEKWKKIQGVSLDELKYYREYSLKLKDTLIEVENDKRFLSGFSGLDYIDSPFHSLPFVFFKTSNFTFNKLIDEIISLIIKADTSKISSKKFISSLKNSFELLFEKPLPSDEEKIIMLITLLMLSRNKDFHPNELAYNWVSDLISKNNYNKEWYLDYLYIQTWTARRIKKYHESIDIAKKGIKDKENDPRFYQSLYLNYYCLYMEEKKQSYLEVAINYCKISYKKYTQFPNNSSIKKSTSAILNSLIYMNSLLYSITKKTNYIEEAQRLKAKLKDFCEHYEDSPEFQHTEAFLELQEYYHTKNYIKLCYATDRINKAINISNKTIYLELKEKIIDILNEINKSC